MEIRFTLTALIFSLFIVSCKDDIIEMDQDQHDHGKYEDWINVQNYKNNTKAFFIDADGHEKEFDVNINDKNNSSFPNIEIRLAEINQGEFDLVIHKFDKNTPFNNKDQIRFSVIYNRATPANELLFTPHTTINFDDNNAISLDEFYQEKLDILGHTYDDVYVFKGITFISTESNINIQKISTLYIQKEIGILAFDYGDDFYIFNRFE